VTSPAIPQLLCQPVGQTARHGRALAGLHAWDEDDIANVADWRIQSFSLTVAEFIPRQVIHLQQILRAFPLISGTTAG
jgi:hypothetical protein